MDWRYNTIWFEQLPEGQLQSLKFGARGTPAAIDSRTRYLIARSFRSASADFGEFPLATLDFLDLTLGNPTTFRGISRAGPLKRLEVSHCYKLADDRGLEEIAGSLEWLHLDTCKRLVPGAGIASLSRLKVLCLNDCGRLPNLAFLAAFPQLLDVRFVKTDIEDGDLTPLLHHPTLCSAGFLDRRHFNLRFAQVEEHLRAKKAAAVVPACKGRYETFRYAAPGDRAKTYGG